MRSMLLALSRRCHHDTLMLCHTQFVGRKRWRFISPLQTPLFSNLAVPNQYSFTNPTITNW